MTAARILITALALAALCACKTEEAAPPAPFPLTQEAVGHFCQMNLLEHPGPKAQILLDGVDAPLFFSQVIDAIAYQRMPEQSHEIRAIYVNDMGAQGATWDDPGPTNWIRAEDAHFVSGPLILGGMDAPELVPFADPAAAAAFAARRGGIVRDLSRIPDTELLSAGVPVPPPGAAEPDMSGDQGDYADRLRALGQDRSNSQ